MSNGQLGPASLSARQSGDDSNQLKENSLRVTVFADRFYSVLVSHGRTPMERIDRMALEEAAVYAEVYNRLHRNTIASVTREPDASGSHRRESAGDEALSLEADPAAIDSGGPEFLEL